MTDNKMNKIADKIQKLLALAGNNPSQEEAQAALLKVQALMAEYSIDPENLTSQEKITYDLVTTKVKAHKFNNHLSCVIADSFACRVFINPFGRLCFFGRSDNVVAATSAFEFAFTAMKNGGNKATRDGGLQPGHKGAAAFYNSYVLGFLSGLKEVMDAQTVALAIVVPQDVHDAFQERFPSTRVVKNSKVQAGLSYDAFLKGKQDGSTVMSKRALA